MRMPDATRLQRGDSVPHFTARAVTGEVFTYATIWQRKNLVLVTVSAMDASGDYVRTLREQDAEFNDLASVCVVTHDPIAGLPAPGALIADRWGEIVHVSAANHVAGLPTVLDLLEWVEHLEHRCPECEGEAR